MLPLVTRALNPFRSRSGPRECTDRDAGGLSSQSGRAARSGSRRSTITLTEPPTLPMSLITSKGRRCSRRTSRRSGHHPLVRPMEMRVLAARSAAAANAIRTVRVEGLVGRPLGVVGCAERPAATTVTAAPGSCVPARFVTIRRRYEESSRHFKQPDPVAERPRDRESFAVTQ